MSKRYLGVFGPAKAWTVSRLHRKHPKILVVTKDRASADDLTSDLRFFLPESRIVSYPAWDTLPLEQLSPHIDITSQRLLALHTFRSEEQFVGVTPAEALLQKTLPITLLESAQFSLARSDVISRDDLLERLDRCGFSRVSLVEEIGDLAVRGGVIDIFPSTTSGPIRIEFLEDIVEKIKRFDPETQRSTGILDRVQILPVREIAPSSAYPDLEFERVKQRGKELETPLREIAKITGYLRSGAHFPAMETFQSLVLDTMDAPLSYLSEKVLVVLSDEVGIRQSLDRASDLIDERVQRCASAHTLIPAREDLYLTTEELLEGIDTRTRIFFDHLPIFGGDEEGDTVVNLRSEPNTELSIRLKSRVGSGDALSPLRDAILRWRDEDYSIGFVVGSHARAERLSHLLTDVGITAHIVPPPSTRWLHGTRRQPIAILEGHLSSGVKLPREKLVFVAEHEIFRERSYRKGAQKTFSLKKLMSSLAQLRENDFVVHADYGVGIYRGLKHIVVDERGSDFLHIEYADSQLYVPVQQIGRVQRFSAPEGQEPVLDKLSSTRWLKTRQKVKESVASLAGDLIKLYATRSVAKGWRYEPFGAEDERFADGFPFDETPDQLKAIMESIGDMAGERPMDRLVCGDVGFGKTEVAIRAAFKCVQHGRQVAVLVPTTILVEQHLRNFQERFAGWPVNVGALSRFYKPQDNHITVERIASGDMDIIIGTHKLLQKEVKFRDLGLLIIDEEHRFGVQQKEKLKQLRSKIDVLTLTATPIPRTLHMSLLGIRDISVITTPPVDRKVIRTYLAHEDKGVVRDALMRELQRKGQCFFVHNRVQSIEMITSELKALVPEARIEFAHGQMKETELEGIVKRFIEQKIDVLVCTTIVESGLDVPNANTIIIDRAHTYGLAQLYQLRGRVGRGTRQAYAYFLIPPAKRLGGEAQERLKVLQSLDDLGMGFNLALRDMEIRGAGNLLGKEQSGNIVSVGFDLYTQILGEAVSHLKGEEIDVSESIDPEVKLGVSAFVPDYYIPDVSERLVLYQRLASVRTSAEADELRQEMEDRFGPLPREASDLVEVMRFRGLLRTHGVVKGEVSKGRLFLSFSPDAHVDIAKILELTKKYPDRYRFGKNLTLSFPLPSEEVEPAELYKPTRSLLEKLRRSSESEKQLAETVSF